MLSSYCEAAKVDLIRRAARRSFLMNSTLHCKIAVPSHVGRARRCFVSVLLATLVGTTVQVRAETGPPLECGKLSLGGQHGPFDYRTQTPDQKALVEDHHFHVEYRAFLRGADVAQTAAGTGPLAGGFDYTLRAFPNHHLALSAMDRLSLRQGKERPAGAKFTARCYFERAIAFVPEDPLVRALYAVYMARRGEADASDDQAKMALSNGSNDGNVVIQVAAAYMLLKRYDQARLHAKKAYELGYPLFGIRDRLIELGEWK